MQADEDGPIRIDGPDHRGPVMDPGPSRPGIARLAEEVRLVAEAPGPHGGMVSQCSAHRAQEEVLGFQDERRDVDVVDRARRTLGVAETDDLPIARVRPAAPVEEPRRCPVRSTHVTREERHLQLEAKSGRDVTDRREVPQRPGVHAVRSRLEALPQEEDAHVREAEVPDDGELVAHLPGIELLPPAHRLAPGPVVDSKQERLTNDARFRRGHRTTSARAIPARRGKTEVLVMALGTRYFARRIRAAYSVGVGLSWSFVPEAGEGVGHGLLLRRRQLTAELALDDAHVLDECLVVSPPPFRRQDDADSAPVAGDRLSVHQASGFDPIHEPGQAAPREERALLELLHPEAVAGGVIELGQDVEPRHREALALDEIALGDPQHLGAREQHAAPRIGPRGRGSGWILVRFHERSVPDQSLAKQILV